jgi:FlaG/FlaF family flagellin (archaellin)
MPVDDSMLADINSADVQALMQLPGVGQAMVERIVGGRPYGSVDNLRRVPGIGDAACARLRSYVQVGRGSDQAGGPDEHLCGTDLPAQRESTGGPNGRAARIPVASTQAAGRGFSRMETIWVALSASAVSLVLSVVLTLAIMVGINGTLDVGRHAAVRQLRADLDQAQASLDGVTASLDSFASRLEALQGLSGRMTIVEDEMTAMRGEIDQATTRVAGMQADLADLRATTDELSGRADAFDAFLDGLRQLLGGNTSPLSATQSP